MKLIVALICAVPIAAAATIVIKFSPLFLNSKIERVHEKNLPRILIEKSGTGSRAVNPVLTGGFDTVDGSAEARFEGTNQVTASEYENWLSGKVPVGGQVSAQEFPGGLLFEFHYFGD
jgi:hypothetical protein